MKIGFAGLLTIVFVTLKLLGKITWNWWLVLLPMYAGIFLFILAFIFLTFVEVGKPKRKWRNR